MRSSLFIRPANVRMVIIREELRGICNGDHAAAVLLNEFEFIARIHGCRFQVTLPEIAEMICGAYGEYTIKKAITLLCELGYLDKERQVNGNEYYLDVDAVNAAIQGWAPEPSAKVADEKPPEPQVKSPKDTTSLIQTTPTDPIPPNPPSQSPPPEIPEPEPLVQRNLQRAIETCCKELGVAKPRWSAQLKGWLRSTESRIGEDGTEAVTEFRDSLRAALWGYALDPSVGDTTQALKAALRRYSSKRPPEKREYVSERAKPSEVSGIRRGIAALVTSKGFTQPEIPEWQWNILEVAAIRDGENFTARVMGALSRYATPDPLLMPSGSALLGILSEEERQVTRAKSAKGNVTPEQQRIIDKMIAREEARSAV